MIDQKGPATKTIFSQCANWEDCQALKEKLNSREQVNWETTCPILVATVLKVGKLLAPHACVSLSPKLLQAINRPIELRCFKT